MLSEKTTLTLIFIVSLLTLALVGLSVSGRMNGSASSVRLGCVLYNNYGDYVGLPTEACGPIAATTTCFQQGNNVEVTHGIGRGVQYSGKTRCDLEQEQGVLILP